MRFFPYRIAAICALLGGCVGQPLSEVQPAVEDPDWRVHCETDKSYTLDVKAILILPTNDGHPVKRVNYATEVNHDKTIRKEKNIPEAAFTGIQEGIFGPGRENRHTQGSQGVGTP